MNYFVWLDGKEYGPFPQNDIAQGIRSGGSIARATHGRREMDSTWRPIQEILSEINNAPPQLSPLDALATATYSTPKKGVRKSKSGSSAVLFLGVFCVLAAVAGGAFFYLKAHPLKPIALGSVAEAIKPQQGQQAKQEQQAKPEQQAEQAQRVQQEQQAKQEHIARQREKQKELNLLTLDSDEAGRQNAQIDFEIGRDELEAKRRSHLIDKTSYSAEFLQLRNLRAAKIANINFACEQARIRSEAYIKASEVLRSAAAANVSEYDFQKAQYESKHVKALGEVEALSLKKESFLNSPQQAKFDAECDAEQAKFEAEISQEQSSK